MKNGFTLLELSIVLVIIGLIVGGVTVGQEMIRSAELKSVTKDKTKILTALNTFKLKYNALPGDMDNAQDYWGITHATPATCKVTASTTGTATCNGDGDGTIEHSDASYEWFRLWQHLANAELILGNFDSIPASAHIMSSDESNSFNSSIAGAGWFLYDRTTTTGNLYWFAGNFGKLLIIGGFDTLEMPRLSIFSPAELYSLDVKFDNGKPGTGHIVAKRWNDCTDATANTEIDSDYILSDGDLLCAAIFTHILK
ncbi:MAG: prepilin-type N-terminal cleavage/methylation domain-containing protein [Rickettsiales bacterium]|nr:prepilin-type N-terminal cleavage/methylation domain-containing protein [Rickettsiales bacterium]